MSPSVGVVIPTRGHRPDRLRAAIRAALGQDHPGPLEVVVVVDGGDPAAVTDRTADLLAARNPATPGGDARPPAGAVRCPAASEGDAWRPVVSGESVRRPAPTGGDARDPAVSAEEAPRRVRVTANRLSPGLPGARNTGIAALGTDLVAFCDDDDEWAPGKVAAQVAALEARPGAEFSSCAIEVEYGSRRVTRLAGTAAVTRAHLLRSRMVMVHSSTFLFRRGAFWADESAPGGQNEDWDLALRAAARHPIAHVDRPLVRVRWGGSAYATRWADRIAGLEWMLARHPDLVVDPRGAARVYGQLAFHHAALGRRREAGRWARRAFTAHRGEPRVPLALAVAAGLVPAATVLGALHHLGRGI